MRQEKVDLFIGNHAGQNNTLERYKRLVEGDPLAFVDPDAWSRFLDGCESAINNLETKDPIIRK